MNYYTICLVIGMFFIGMLTENIFNGDKPHVALYSALANTSTLVSIVIGGIKRSREKKKKQFDEFLNQK